MKKNVLSVGLAGAVLLAGCGNEIRPIENGQQPILLQSQEMSVVSRAAGKCVFDLIQSSTGSYEMVDELGVRQFEFKTSSGTKVTVKNSYVSKEKMRANVVEESDNGIQFDMSFMADRETAFESLAFAMTRGQLEQWRTAKSSGRTVFTPEGDTEVVAVINKPSNGLYVSAKEFAENLASKLC